MKFKVSSNEFSKALKLCYNAIDQKDEVRSNISIGTEEGGIGLMSTNGVYTIAVHVSADVEEDGGAVVDGKMIYNVISKASGDCKITADDRSMVINANGRTKLPNIDRDLPVVAGVDGNSVVFDGVAFKNAIEKIIYAIGEDQSRLILTGAHIVTDGSFATITSLDGFRLAQTKFECEGDNIDIVVPSRILQAICDAITDGNLHITTNGMRITAYGDNYTICAVLLSGEYIDTQRIVPTQFKTNVLVNTSDIKQIVDTASIASGSSNLIKFSISEDKMSIMSNSEKADFEGDVSAIVDGDIDKIAFNLKYLSQALSHIPTEQCEIRLNSSISPAIFAPHMEGCEDIHLILPVRIM